jgi:3-oxoacyl-[acyl-carrier-protein] synthase-1
LGADLLLDVATRNKHLPLNQEAERISDEVIRSSATDLLDKAAHSAKWPGRPSLAASSAAGHAGVAVLLQQAQQDLIDGSSKSAIVGGIDSLLGEETLTWLLNTGRLKTPSTAAGVMPGEGAALLHLSHRQDSGQVLVRSIALRQEDSSLLRGEQPMGKALAQAVWDIAPGQPALLSSDHNGEGYRGAEFGRTLLNIQRAVPDLSYRDIYLPAQSFGDTGAATGAIAIAQLAGMWARSTFRQDFGIALASSDGPQRAAVLIERRKVS